MAKLILLFTTLALFLLIANASIYRIEIEDLEDEFDLDENPQQQIGKHCRKEFVTHKHLKACQRFIRRQARSPRDEVVDDVSDEENSGQLLQNCCQQLKRIDVPCRCPSLKWALKRQLQPSIELELPEQQKEQGQQGQQQQQGQQGKGHQWKVQKMIKTASNLPSICQIPPQSCPFKQPRWWFDE